MRLIFLISIVLIPLASSKLDSCKKPPSWKIDGVNPLQKAAEDGKVVVLALLKAS